MEGLKPFYEISGETVQVPDWNGTGYRLPTEAEWEYACCAGTATRYSFGDDEASLGEFSWFYGTRIREPMRWARSGANGIGLHDMHGNVWEWCWDWYSADYYKEPPVDDPRGPSQASFRVFRGGCWFDDPRDVRSAYRIRVTPDDRSMATWASAWPESSPEAELRGRIGMEAELVVEGLAGGATESRGGAQPAGAGATGGVGHAGVRQVGVSRLWTSQRLRAAPVRSARPWDIPVCRGEGFQSVFGRCGSV